MTQTIVPRPIAWVLTPNRAGVEQAFNLAPFSFFNAISADPALLVLGFTLKNDGSTKDTWENLLTQKTCTIHMADGEQLESLIKTSAELPYGQSEVDVNQIELTPFEGHSVPRIKAAPVAFACRLHSHQTFGKDNGSGVVFCEIMHIYIADNICAKTAQGRVVVDVAKYMPPARLGGINYATAMHIEQRTRPEKA